jgi:hypothetical protein
VLAPNAKLRGKIISNLAERATEASTDHAHTESAPARMSGARLLKRVFDNGIEHCTNCELSSAYPAAPCAALMAKGQGWR